VTICSFDSDIFGLFKRPFSGGATGPVRKGKCVSAYVARSSSGRKEDKAKMNTCDVLTFITMEIIYF
jgi:hypothetical protein